MDKNKLIIINGFPNNEKKIHLIEEQISYFRKLEYPILLISGCVIPESLLSKVDYFILNTENEVIGKDFTQMCYDSPNPNVAFIKFPVFDDRGEISLFDTNVNCTITKNIKLAFNLASNLGFTSVFYTEDDNIFKDKALPYITKYLDLIESKEYNIATVVGEESAVIYPILFTTLFFANVQFMLDNFTIPSNKEDWYIEENIYKYGLSRTYEGAFYHIMAPYIDTIYNIESDFVPLVNDKHIEWGKVNRFHNEHHLLDVFFNIVPDKDGNPNLILFNQSNWMLEGDKPYKIKIYFDDNFIQEIELATSYHYYMYPLSLETQQVKLEIEGYGTKILLNHPESVKINGKLLIW